MLVPLWYYVITSTLQTMKSSGTSAVLKQGTYWNKCSFGEGQYRNKQWNRKRDAGKETRYKQRGPSIESTRAVSEQE